MAEFNSRLGPLCTSYDALKNLTQREGCLCVNLYERLNMCLLILVSILQSEQDMDPSLPFQASSMAFGLFHLATHNQLYDPIPMGLPITLLRKRPRLRSGTGNMANLLHKHIPRRDGLSPPQLRGPVLLAWLFMYYVEDLSIKTEASWIGCTLVD